MTILGVIFSASKWREQAKDVWLSYSWEDFPLEVKTISAVGSNHEIFFEVANTAYSSFARVVVRLSRDPIYFIQSCYSDTPLQNFTDVPDNIRIWKFTKNGFDGLSIECNGVAVADIKFSEARAECSSSQWLTTKVNFIKFNPDWDKTVAVKIRSKFHRSVAKSYFLIPVCVCHSDCSLKVTIIIHRISTTFTS